MRERLFEKCEGRYNIPMEMHINVLVRTIHRAEYKGNALGTGNTTERARRRRFRGMEPYLSGCSADAGDALH